MEAHKNETEKHEASHEREGDERAHIEKKREGEPDKKEAKLGAAARAAKKVKNNVRKLRMERMMSKAELARRAGVSTLTIDRVERGMSCRMDTKRKILEALGLVPQDRVMVFGDAEED
ncbi:MAG TPA: helix-turn-helix transcriptional regulator [Myxococcales bacterium]|nr:helix-turn-helix transcriptional regulator [Myxococcales bacterium]